MRPNQFWRCIIIALFLIGTLRTLKADVFIQEEMRSGRGEAITRTMWIGKNCARVDTEDGRSTQTIIIFPEKDRYYELRHSTKQYWWFTKEGLLKSDGTFRDIKVTDSGMMKKIKNWFCRKYIIEAKTDSIYTQKLEAWAMEEVKVDSSLYAMMHFSYPRVPGSGLLTGPQLDEFLKELQKIKGIIVAVKREEGTSYWESEVTDIAQQVPPSGIYEIPSSYTDLVSRADFAGAVQTKPSPGAAAENSFQVMLNSYFDAVKQKDNGLMSALALEPLQPDMTKWSIIKIGEEKIELATLPALNAAEIEAKKAQDAQIGPTIDADSALKDAQHEKELARSAAGKAAAQKNIDKFHAAYDIENGKMQELKRAYNAAKAAARQEEEIALFSLGTRELKNIRELKGAIHNRKVEVAVSTNNGLTKNYNVYLCRYRLNDPTRSYDGRWVIIRFEPAGSEIVSSNTPATAAKVVGEKIIKEAFSIEESKEVSFNVQILGTIQVEAMWKGEPAGLILELYGPRKKGFVNSILRRPYQNASGRSPLKVSQVVSNEILALGTQWRVKVSNFKGEGRAEGTLIIKYPE